MTGKVQGLEEKPAFHKRVEEAKEIIRKESEHTEKGHYIFFVAHSAFVNAMRGFEAHVPLASVIYM